VAAHARYAESLSLQSAIGDKRGQAHSLLGLASVAAATGRWTPSVRLLAATESLCRAINLAFERAEQGRRASTLAAARAALSAADFDAHWAAGAQLPLDAAIELASALAPTSVT
jgi:hypothetical protein